MVTAAVGGAAKTNGGLFVRMIMATYGHDKNQCQNIAVSKILSTNNGTNRIYNSMKINSNSMIDKKYRYNLARR